MHAYVYIYVVYLYIHAHVCICIFNYQYKQHNPVSVFPSLVSGAPYVHFRRQTTCVLLCPAVHRCTGVDKSTASRDVHQMIMG